MTAKRVHRIRQQKLSVRSLTIGSTRRADTSRQITQEDAFTTTGIGKSALLPPYDPRFLSQCVERSNMLKQCIAAMVTNVGMVGFEVVPTDRALAVDDAEREELQSFIDACNSEESLVTVHTRAVDDYETYGYCFLEAIRDRKGRISLLRHMPAYTTRLLPKDLEPELVEYEVNRGRRTATVQEYRTFRRYVQIVNGKTRYFREFGDQRVLNMETGEYGTCPVALRATEVIHIRQNSNDPYGVPRWINQLPSILGSREAEECNLRYFEDNTIPPMILSVAGGRLTSQSYKELKDILLKQGIGVDRQNKMILIEAVPEREGLDEKGSTVTLKVDKLTDARQSDGLFSQYDEANQAKVRSSFRLPPVAVGLSQDVTFATANVSAFIAETQVYLPLRNVFDEVYNKRLVISELGLGMRTCRLSSSVPLMSNGDSIVKALTALNTMGAITPRMANELGNRVLQLDIPAYPKAGEEGYEEWMDQPILFVTRGTASQAGQEQKTDKIKDIEDSGDTGPDRPENGQQ
jgi:PBSX family phage portal protein